ncbi:hypothetical protein K0U07_01320 [bacterium]|nr:hypothetical protein [bacterium]
MRTSDIIISIGAGHKDLFIRSCKEISLKNNLTVAIPVALTYIFVSGTVVTAIGVQIKNVYLNAKQMSKKEIFFTTVRTVLSLFLAFIPLIILFDVVLRRVDQEAITKVLYRYSATVVHFPGLTVTKMITLAPAFSKEAIRITHIAFKIISGGIVSTCAAIISFTGKAFSHLHRAGSATLDTTCNVVKTVFTTSIAHLKYCYHNTQLLY